MKDILKRIVGFMLFAVLAFGAAAIIGNVIKWSRRTATIAPTTTLEYIIHEERGVICFYLQGFQKEGLSCLYLKGE